MTADGLVLREIASDTTLDAVIKATGATLHGRRDLQADFRDGYGIRPLPSSVGEGEVHQCAKAFLTTIAADRSARSSFGLAHSPRDTPPIG